MSAVSIERRLLDRIDVREWGLPTLLVPGKIWRSEVHKTISCMVPEGADHARIETRQMHIVEDGVPSDLPDHWRDAMWEYVQAYPSCGCALGPFLRISEECRSEFVKQIAHRLMACHNAVSCLLLARDIGLLAAIEFERPG